MTSTALRGIKPPIFKDTEALTKVPPVPVYLSIEAKAEWKRIMPQLIARRILTRGDLAGVEHYCSAVGLCRQIEAGGWMSDRTQFGIWNRAAQTARQLASEYGLTPVSRSRIGGTLPPDDADDDPLAV